jgi:hypothetical protein
MGEMDAAMATSQNDDSLLHLDEAREEELKR